MTVIYTHLEKIYKIFKKHSEYYRFLLRNFLNHTEILQKKAKRLQRKSNKLKKSRLQFAKSRTVSRAKRHSGGPTGPSLSYAMKWIAWGPRWVNYKVRRNADSPSWSLVLLLLLTLSPILPSPSCFCKGSERPTSIQHFGPRYDTPSAWLLYCEIYSALFVPPLTISLLSSLLFPFSSFNTFFFFLCTFASSSSSALSSAMDLGEHFFIARSNRDV